MSTTPPERDLVMVLSPCGELESSPRVPVAARRGGGLGVLDLGRGDHRALRALELAVSLADGPIGVRVAATCTAAIDDVRRAGDGRIDLVVLTSDSPWAVSDLLPDHRVIVEVTDRDEALRAAEQGAHGLIARGMESGGRVSDLSAFVLMQQLVADETIELPVWVAGGIGPRTAAACAVGGAAGVVLDSQLALMPESDLPDDATRLIRGMDGSETVLVDGVRGTWLGERRLPPTRQAAAGQDGRLLPVGQDGWLAASMMRRWPDTAAVVRAVRGAMLDALNDATAGALLEPGAPLASTLGVRLPVAQGPMTRVSDQAGFAAAVAAEGALPFIALALSDARRSRTMLAETAAAVGGRPWGVGVLGFAPEELRAAQIEVVRELRPSCVIIAGGRPAQAKGLEDDGIAAYLHVPSPGLLRQYLRAGARSFVFEGAECGGHVGPRSSFALWEAQFEVLTEFLDTQPAEAAADIRVFFAGGIHDARSAAMVSALAAPLVARGVQAGVLMGTAYLFTEEAVGHGAIQPAFQREVLAARRTALLETAPGHATRCLQTPFVGDFHALRDELEASGVDSREVWEQLETFNVGRLRVASKALRREGDTLVRVDESAQLTEGLFMAGQAAVLRSARTTVAQLHDDVTSGAVAFHADRVAAWREGRADPEGRQAPAQPPVDIAIVGIACMFADSPDLPAFWRTVVGATDAVTEVPGQRWDVETYYQPKLEAGQSGRVTISKWGGFLAPVPFDPIRYGIPPAALASIEPTQLLALEAAYRSLLDAGYPHDAPAADHSRTGVVFGAEGGSDMSNAAVVRALLPSYVGEVPPQLDAQLPTITEDTFPGMLSNVIAGRIANRLDLGGANYTVDAACAASLAAVDAATRELASGSADLMLCGGVDVHNGINDYLLFTSVHALSPTGRCRTFDQDADGISLGEGVACVVLKRLADAQRDGDRVYAVIKGVGSASDGRALGLTAPRPEGQRRALERAYQRAGLSPRQVGLVEAHGTGTVVGDRTELETLTRLFTESGVEPGACALGSVKSQIGHTKCAAGLAGLIKAAMSIHSGVLPPTVNLRRPNPAWDPAKSPFVFHTSARPWTRPVAERVAGVSAFGFGGTNFHVVLQGHAATPEPRHGCDAWPAELFCFRGADRPAAHRAVQKLAADLADGAPSRRPLRDLAAKLSRESDARSGPVQVAVVARDREDLAVLLRRALAGEHDPDHGLVQPTPPVSWDGAGKVAYLFPGQGSQRPHALAELFVAFPEIRTHLGDFADLLFPPAAFDQMESKEQEGRLRDTRVAQPVLGIAGLAVEHLLHRLGVRPDMAGGHSYGELVALCAAGAFDAATLLRLSQERAEAILGAAGEDPGAMAAVSAGAAEVTAVLERAGLAGDVVLANHNAPTQVVVSGTTPAIEAAVGALAASKLSVRRLPVACAFHSPVVAGAGPRFAGVLADTPVRAPGMQVWSNRTATPYPADAAQVRHELAAQIGSPVRFVEEIEAMYAAGARVFVEVGPGQVLTGLVRAVLGDRPHLAVACERRSGQGLRGFLISLAQLACAGVPVQSGWLFAGRVPETPAVPESTRPVWTVDGQLVRDPSGAYPTGGLVPARPVKELSMTASGHAESDGRAQSHPDALLSEFLHASREMIAAQRDVMLAYFGESPSGRLVWQPAGEMPAVAAVPALVPVATPAATTAIAVAVPAEPAHVTLDFHGAVLAVISERTGYPADLIELDLDLEADLSIDSIKRAEVAGEVAARLQLATDGDQSELEDLVRARTVRGMVDWLTQRMAGELAAAAPAPAALVQEDADGPGIAPQRLVFRPTPIEATAGEPGALTGTAFLVIGDSPAAGPLVDLLVQQGVAVRTWAAVQDGSPTDGVDRLDGLICLEPDDASAGPILPGLFPTVQRALAGKLRWLVAAATTPTAAGDGLRGFMRTVHREYPDITARLVGTAPGAEPEAVAAAVLADLLATDREPVVVHSDGGRFAATPVAAGLGTLADGGAGPAGDGTSEAQAIGLDRDSVVVLFGGARGITPWFAKALATAGRCRLELVGRTPMPDDAEEPDLAAALDKAALRAALSRRGMRSPAEIDRAAQGILAGREVATTLAELADLGATVRYHSLDVQDEDAVHRLLKDLHSEHGRIDGLVHAAGIIEDRLLAEKDPESFARVFSTKVNGARTVLRTMEQLGCDPRFTVFFGSIAAVYGNRGQGDYAAANDALESMGARWSADTGNRCLTVHWGPWAPVGAHGGMVSPELSREYAKRGIALIAPEEGALSLLRELAWGDRALTSVVYTASAW